MLGPMGAHVISVLRVMTPSEIDRYAQGSSGKKVQALAAGGEDLRYDESAPRGGGGSHFKKMSEAEIIPIRGEEEAENFPQNKDKNSSHDQNANQKKESNELEKAGVFSRARLEDFRRRKTDLEKACEDSSSVFLLKQRERLKRTNIKMVGSAALKTYCQTAQADMTQPEPDLEDPDAELPQGSKGILINKKHY